MNRPGAQALSDELMQGQAALEALPIVLDDARRLKAKTAACATVLSGIRGATSERRPMPSDDFSKLRRSFLRQVRRPRRALSRRIAWLSWLRFWRAARYWILLLFLFLIMLAAALWAFENRHWLVDQIQSRLALPALAPADPASSPAPLAPTPVPAGGTP